MSSACRDINELLPAAQKACRLFMKKCREAGLKIFITETYRSQARQNELYNQGRTTPGQIVTWTKKSNHLTERSKKPVSDWASEEFKKATEAGVVDGIMPQAFATREQVVAMILRSIS